MCSTQLRESISPFEKKHDVHVDNEQGIRIIELMKLLRALAATLGF
jgi:hypothetical protein